MENLTGPVSFGMSLRWSVNLCVKIAFERWEIEGHGWFWGVWIDTKNCWRLEKCARVLHGTCAILFRGFSFCVALSNKIFVSFPEGLLLTTKECFKNKNPDSLSSPEMSSDPHSLRNWVEKRGSFHNSLSLLISWTHRIKQMPGLCVSSKMYQMHLFLTFLHLYLPLYSHRPSMHSSTSSLHWRW